MTGHKKVKLANGRELSALEIQGEYCERATAFVEREGLDDPIHKSVLELWQRTLRAIARRTGPGGDRDRLDHQISADSRATAPNTTSPCPARGSPSSIWPITTSTVSAVCSNLLQKHGNAARVSSDPEIFEAKTVPPQTTRAKLRGDFIRAAQEHKRDFHRRLGPSQAE
jgi:proteasome accessory factor A